MRRRDVRTSFVRFVVDVIKNSSEANVDCINEFEKNENTIDFDITFFVFCFRRRIFVLVSRISAAFSDFEDDVSLVRD